MPRREREFARARTGPGLPWAQFHRPWLFSLQHGEGSHDKLIITIKLSRPRHRTGRFRDASRTIEMGELKKNSRCHGSNGYSGISVEYFFFKKVDGGIFCIRRIYKLKGFFVRGLPALLSATA